MQPPDYYADQAEHALRESRMALSDSDSDYHNTRAQTLATLALTAALERRAYPHPDLAGGMPPDPVPEPDAEGAGRLALLHAEATAADGTPQPPGVDPDAETEEWLTDDGEAALGAQDRMDAEAVSS